MRFVRLLMGEDKMFDGLIEYFIINPFLLEKV
jgi:hypothetical protein